MAEVRPFCGILYNQAQVDLEDVVTPPYDVISAEAQEEYYHRSPFNIIRLEHGMEMQGDNPKRNKYTRARAYFRQWLKDRILIQDELPAFYVYEQCYTLPDGRSLTRRGFLGALKLEPFERGIVLPHEETLSKPKNDRLQLMRACQANFSPIFGLYQDPDGQVARILADVVQTTTRADVTTDAGIRERLWSVEDPALQAQITAALQDQVIYIADGHHRYETALAYRDERMQEGEVRGDEPYNYIMTMLVSLQDEGLTVLPTHRLVKQFPGEISLSGFLSQAIPHFEVVVFPYGNVDLLGQTVIMSEASESAQWQAAATALQEHKYAFLLQWRDVPAFYILKLKEGVDPTQVIAGSQAPAWKELDVSILQTLLFEPVGIGPAEITSGEYLAYTRDITEATLGVKSGAYQASFILKEPQVAQVQAVAEAGAKMPQKSTYFYPKLLTGLVINSLA